MLLKNATPQSILSLQERVFLQLHPESQQRFSIFDLKSAQEVVRDDPGAQRLYYQILTRDFARSSFHRKRDKRELPRRALDSPQPNFQQRNN